MNACEVCGFLRDDVTILEIPRRIVTSTDSFVDLIGLAGDNVSVRPSPERWSILEYGGHLRDVLISLRERLITASIEDEPTGVAIHRDERIFLGFYGRDTPLDVTTELAAISRLFVRTIESIPPGFEEREMFFSPASPHRVSVLWLGAQALHESEHHLSDVRENLERLTFQS
jgi:hypothetical protein